MLFDLTGQVALITGSSRGIGRSTAEEMAKLGARVVISSRKKEACEAVAAEIRAAGGDAVAIPCNIARKDEVENLVQQTIAHFGQIDILVCNAAVNPHFGPMHTASDEQIDKIFSTNVRSNMWLCQMALPQMAERKRGSVIIVSSIAGLVGQQLLGVYGLAKAADMQLARNLAVEWGAHGIRANAISPGLVRTDMARAIWENPDVYKAMCAASPLGRIGEPIDIAGIACFLASAAAHFITGQVIVADGGVTIADRFAVS